MPSLSRQPDIVRRDTIYLNREYKNLYMCNQWFADDLSKHVGSKHKNNGTEVLRQTVKSSLRQVKVMLFVNNG